LQYLQKSGVTLLLKQENGDVTDNVTLNDYKFLPGRSECTYSLPFCRSLTCHVHLNLVSPEPKSTAGIGTGLLALFVLPQGQQLVAIAGSDTGTHVALCLVCGCQTAREVLVGLLHRQVVNRNLWTMTAIGEPVPFTPNRASNNYMEAMPLVREWMQICGLVKGTVRTTMHGRLQMSSFCGASFAFPLFCIRIAVPPCQFLQQQFVLP